MQQLLAKATCHSDDALRQAPPQYREPRLPSNHLHLHSHAPCLLSPDTYPALHARGRVRENQALSFPQFVPNATAKIPRRRCLLKKVRLLKLQMPLLLLHLPHYRPYAASQVPPRWLGDGRKPPCLFYPAGAG